MSTWSERVFPPEDDFDAEDVARLGAGHLLRQGVELFNAGQYRQAHEPWEKVWLTGTQDGDFWKGLIQAAIALHHFERGELEGARKLYRGHRGYLGAYVPQHRGIRVEKLLTDMQLFLRPVVRATEGTSIPFDACSAPRIELVASY